MRKKKKKRSDNMAHCIACFTEVEQGNRTQCTKCNSIMHKECVINDNDVALCDICFVVKDKESNKVDFEMPEFVRRTHIETYRACPYKFYQEVIKGHAMPPNEYTQVGSDVHEVIENAILNGLSYNDAYVLIDNYFNDYEDELFKSKTKEEMYKRATDSIDTFYDKVLPSIRNVFAVEETIFTNLGDNIPDMRITMDLITKEDGELHMHDWKTGGVMVGKKLSSDLQAPLYIYSVLKHYDKPVKSFTFYYLQENKTRTFVRSEINPDVYVCTVGKREYKVVLQDAIREVKSLFSKIQKGLFNPIQPGPDKYFTQKMCHLKELGLCCQDVDPWNTV